jgi:hypothetical protein
VTGLRAVLACQIDNKQVERFVLALEMKIAQEKGVPQ